MNVPPFLKSRKFWALILGAAVVVLRSYVPNFPLADEQVTELGLLIVAYIIGTGLQDSSERSAVTVQLNAMNERMESMRLQLSTVYRSMLSMQAERSKQASRN